MSKRKDRTSGPGATTPGIEPEFQQFLAENKLSVYAKTFETHGIFGLEDFRLLNSSEIEQLAPAVDGIGYRKRLRSTFAKQVPAAEEKDGESAPPVEPPQRQRGEGNASRQTVKKPKKAPARKQQPSKPKLEKRPASPPVEENDFGIITFILVFMLMVTLLGMVVFLKKDLKILSQRAGLSKGYPGRKIWSSIKKFYPFYLGEHKDPTNQLMHASVTAFSLLVAVLNPALFISVVAGICAGLVAMPFCIGFSSGVVEGLVMFFTAQLSAYAVNKWRLLMFLVILGYGVAWVGHYQFEKNTPATFQAPTYSLLSDFLLMVNYWRQVILSKEIPLVKSIVMETSVIDPKTFDPIFKTLQGLLPVKTN